MEVLVVAAGATLRSLGLMALVAAAGCARHLDSPESRFAAHARARALYESGRVKQAGSILSSLSRDTQDTDLWTNLGIVEWQRGAHDRAAQAWENAVRCDPTSARARYWSARAEWERAQALGSSPKHAERVAARLAAATEAIERAVAAAPGEAAVHVLAAAIARTRGDAAAAERALAAARRLDPAVGNEPEGVPGFARFQLAAPPRNAAAGEVAVTLESEVLPARAADVVAFDLDGDGRPDPVLLGTGDALRADTLAGRVTWTRQPLLPEGRIARTCAAPLDGDGLDDLVLFEMPVVDAAGSSLSRTWLVHGGRGGLEPLPELESAVRAARAVDLDRDGDPDLLLATAGRPGLRIWRNDGGARFAPVEPAAALAALPALRDVASADLDGDALVDIVCAEAGGRTRVFLQRGGGVWVDATTLAGFALERARCIALLDADGDARLDVLLGNDAGLWVFANGGGGRFARTAAFRSPQTTWWNRPEEGAGVAGLGCADFDNDGFQDLVTVHPRRVETAAPLVAAAGAPPAGEDAAPPLPPLADLVCPLGVRVWRNAGAGVLLDATDRLGLTATALEAPPAWADFDLDGDLDGVVAAADSSVHVLWNRGGEANRALHLALAGRRGAPSAVGAQVEACTGGFVQHVLVSRMPAWIGIGRATRLEVLRVAWPDGTIENRLDVEVPADGRLTLQEHDPGR